MPNEKMHIYAHQNDDSVSYGVAVERNRQFFATRHTVEHVRYRRTLFRFFSVARRLAMPFLPEGGKDALFSFWNILTKSQKER